MRSFVLMTLVIPSALFAQDPPRPDAPKPEAVRPGPGPMAVPSTDPKPYDKVITKDAVSTPGIFTVHKLKDRYYYEIPVAEFGKDFLWVQQIARTTIGVGYGGQSLGNRVVRWERRGNKILLRDVDYNIVADPKSAIARAVADANVNAIVQAFNVEAEGPGKKSVVIEVTRLFSSEVPELSARTRLRARGFDGSRSFVDRVSAFPGNIEVEATHTYTAPPDAPVMGGPPSPFAAPPMRGNSATVVLHYSMVKLPEKPMTPRLADSRVGYFTTSQTDFSVDEPRAPRVRFITRWRLEKKDPSAAISDPVKPIEYYVDPATPPKYVPYVKAGIEEWQKAFEAAGFRKAIVAKDAPVNDPSWSPEDARYSVVRWLPSDIENAVGPSIRDPRSGEILDADIQMYHNVMKLASAWYFTQAAPLDPRAARLPLPDDLMGRLIQFVVAHEVGHTLGFPHNMKASSMYSIANVRDREWVKKMGHTPSIMDYSRFNYVAQPADKIDPADLVPSVGPYDIWATKWGYAPVPGAANATAELPTLNQWAREQEKSPWLRFSTARSNGADPGEVTEAVGDADPVTATGLGVNNLKQVMNMLIPAIEKPGTDWTDLEEMYGRVIGQWTREMMHVVGVVGGVQSQQKHGGQLGVLFTTIPADEQRRALQFLRQQVFQTPTFLVNKEILRRIETDGVMARIRNAQWAVLERLVESSRIGRMVEQEVLDGPKAYKATQLLTDLRSAVFEELSAPRVAADPFRRNLHQAYLDVVAARVNGGAAPADKRWMFRGELRNLQAQIATAIPRSADASTKLYLEDLKDQVGHILDPKFVAPAPFGAAAVIRRALDEPDPLSCWRELIVDKDGIRLQ